MPLGHFGLLAGLSGPKMHLVAVFVLVFLVGHLAALFYGLGVELTVSSVAQMGLAVPGELVEVADSGIFVSIVSVTVLVTVNLQPAWNFELGYFASYKLGLVTEQLAEFEVVYFVANSADGVVDFEVEKLYFARTPAAVASQVRLIICSVFVYSDSVVFVGCYLHL